MGEEGDDLRGPDLGRLGEAVVGAQRREALLGPLHVHQPHHLCRQLLGRLLRGLGTRVLGTRRLTRRLRTGLLRAGRLRTGVLGGTAVRDALGTDKHLDPIMPVAAAALAITHADVGEILV